MIKVRDLRKVYGSGPTATLALKGVDLEIHAGEFVAVMGRSGSGKSTLLHLLGLLDRPTSGGILIENTDVLRLSERQRTRFRLERLGYVFQEYSLIPELTILENVYLPSLCCNGGKNNRQRAGEMLEVVGLGERLGHYPAEVSGGEQQRVAIARALINRPRTLFADEPTASLDATSAGVVLDLFRRLNHEMGQTIVMVTHEPEDERFVDRVIWLKDGLVDPVKIPVSR
ncbi:MAG: ABC transporter ATP-binding protein [Chloroflexi bacterium]|nr:ABC transporter ATP-binding protein [Chloroflexota bacterium]